MKHSCYIIYSSLIDRYYVGETQNIDIRLTEHISGKFAGSFTAKTNDWKIVWFLECESKTQAKQIERHIKNMKSRAYFEKLQNYPDMKNGLLLKFPVLGSSR